MRREIMVGLRCVFKQPVLRAMTACTFSKEFCGGIYGALVVLYMVRDLVFGVGILGSIWALGGLGSLIGSMSAGPISRRSGVDPVMIAGLILYSSALLLIPLAHGASFIAALLLIAQQIPGDGAATLYQVNLVSMRQAITPERVLGRVCASIEFLRLGAALTGSIAGGLMGNRFGVRPTLLVGALGSLLATLWLVASPIPRLRIFSPSMIEAVPNGADTA